MCAAHSQLHEMGDDIKHPFMCSYDDHQRSMLRQKRLDKLITELFTRTIRSSARIIQPHLRLDRSMRSDSSEKIHAWIAQSHRRRIRGARPAAVEARRAVLPPESVASSLSSPERRLPRPPPATLPRACTHTAHRHKREARLRPHTAAKVGGYASGDCDGGGEQASTPTYQLA